MESIEASPVRETVVPKNQVIGLFFQEIFELLRIARYDCSELKISLGQLADREIGVAWIVLQQQNSKHFSTRTGLLHLRYSFSSVRPDVSIDTELREPSAVRGSFSCSLKSTGLGVKFAPNQNSAMHRRASLNSSKLSGF